MTIILDTLKGGGGNLILDNLQNGVAPLPAIVSVGTCRDGASCVLTVSNASVSGNSVYLDESLQDITAESATEITFTVDGDLSYRDADVSIIIANSSGALSPPRTATLLPQTGYRTQMITVAPPVDATSRLASDPDIEIGTQAIYGAVTGTGVDENDVDIFSNGVMRWRPEVETLQVRLFDGSGTSTPVTQTFDPAPLDPVTVPDVTNDDYLTAFAALEALTLVIVPIETNSDTVPEGFVISTQPSAGMEVPQGSSIEVVVSIGPAPRAVPNVVSQQVQVAVQNLSNAGFAGSVRYTSSEIQPGIVLQQSVAPGTLLPPGSRINLLVSSFYGVRTLGAIDFINWIQ